MDIIVSFHIKETLTRTEPFFSGLLVGGEQKKGFKWIKVKREGKN